MLNSAYTRPSTSIQARLGLMFVLPNETVLERTALATQIHSMVSSAIFILIS